MFDNVTSFSSHLPSPPSSPPILIVKTHFQQTVALQGKPSNERHLNDNVTSMGVFACVCVTLQPIEPFSFTCYLMNIECDCFLSGMKLYRLCVLDTLTCMLIWSLWVLFEFFKGKSACSTARRKPKKHYPELLTNLSYIVEQNRFPVGLVCSK